MLDDTPKDDAPLLSHSLQQKIPHTPINVIWSTRLSRPPERFYPSLYTILLIDVGELEYYDEAMQVDTKIQWESTMKD